MNNNPSKLDAMVAEHINNVDDKGKLQLPDTLSDVEKEVVRQTKRTRDAQSELSKTQTQLREIKAVNDMLSDNVMGIIPEDFKMSDTDLQHLDEIKFKDPDAYRLKVNELETQAREFQTKRIGELSDTARSEATNSFNATNRVTVLQEFRASNPDLVITDDVLVNDVPPRFMNDLNNGKTDYLGFLENVKTYLEKGAAVQSNAPANQHNPANLLGGRTPGAKASENAGNKDYAKITL